MSLGGLWGSFFSRVDGHAMRRMPHPKWRVISITVKEFKYKDQAITSDPGTAGLAPAMEKEVRDLLAQGNP
jgi:hypothetical protein